MSYIEGLDNVFQGMDSVIRKVVSAENTQLKLAGRVVHEAVKNQAGLTDHTLDDLAALGHPYSTRFPDNTGPHGDDTQVHIQSGLLQANIEKVEDINDTVSRVAVGVSASKVPYITDLMEGGPKMRPRRFITRAFDISKPIVSEILSGRMVE